MEWISWTRSFAVPEQPIRWAGYRFKPLVLADFQTAADRSQSHGLCSHAGPSASSAAAEAFRETYAGISAGTRDFGYVQKTTIEEGIPEFLEQYKDYHRI
jgi:hypothetical protein